MSTITLTPAQAEVVKRMNEYLDSSTDYAPFTLTGIGGAGKAQPLSSKIYTPHGYKLMGDIKVGDIILTVNGSTPVVGVYPQGEKDIYKITFSDGSSTKCCKEHLWQVRKRNKVDSIKSLEDLSVDYLYTKPDGRIEKLYQIPLTAAEFSEQLIKIPPYVLGCILGDGNISDTSVIITSVDQEILDNISHKLGKHFELKQKIDDKISYRIVDKRNTNTNALIQWLKELNLFGSNCLSKFIPDTYLYNSKQVRLELLKGLMDTDGTVDYRKSSMSFNTSSDKLKDDIIKLVQSLGGIATITKERYPQFTYKGEKKISDNLNWEITINLPNLYGAPFKLTRKRKLWQPKTDYTPKRHIAYIEYIGKEITQCIEVKDDSHLYLTDDFIVTHNTTVVREVVKFRSGVIGATISHSAKFVLEQSLGGYAQCFTIAQLLGLKQVIGEDGEISFLPNLNRNPEKRLPIEKARIVIIDECSMIDKDTYEFLMSLKDVQCKIIFMGDPFQLPPVEDSSDSITFNHTKAELLQAMRYSGPIADLGNRIREEINKINEEDEGTRFLLNFWQTDELGHDCRTSCVNEDGSGYIFLNNIDDVVRIAISAFRNNDDSEAMRLIAYRNSSIQKINSVIRAQLYCDGDDSKVDDIPQFMPGELVICDGGYSVLTPNAPFPIPIIHNNQTFKVVGTLPIDGPDEIRSLSMNLSPKPPIPENSDIVCLDWENGRYQYFEKHNELKNRAKEDGKLWPAYYRFKQQWAWFEYAYAINSHRG